MGSPKKVESFAKAMQATGSVYDTHLPPGNVRASLIKSRGLSAENMGARRRTSPNLYAQPTMQPGGAPRPHWMGKMMPSAMPRPERRIDKG